MGLDVVEEFVAAHFGSCFLFERCYSVSEPGTVP